jgi:hypothetical protein
MVGDDSDAQAQEDLSPGEPEEEDQLFTSEAALSTDEARSITSRRGATVVLLLGEVGTGKTTLLAESWELLLNRGVIGRCRFAGSRTALAFEERAYYSRIESGLRAPVTPRTQEQDDGFLHLRMRRPAGDRKELLLADVTGEHFERVREGAQLRQEFDWIDRVDRFLVVLDGQCVATPGEREVAITRTRRLLYALQPSGVVASSARVALGLVKSDALSDEDWTDYGDVEDNLLRDVRSVDPEAPAFRTAARPQDSGPPRGLDDVFEWLCEDDRSSKPPQLQGDVLLQRAIGRFHQ